MPHDKPEITYEKKCAAGKIPSCKQMCCRQALWYKMCRKSEWFDGILIVAWPDFVLFAFITGNSSLKPLLTGLLFQIHMDLSSHVSAGIETGTCG